MGEPLLKIYSFPEYTVLRQIKILNFIENIENISAFIWYFDLFITLSTLISNIKSTLPKKYNLIYFYPLMFIVLIIASIFVGGNYSYILRIVKIYPLTLGIFFVIFLSLLIHLKLNNKTNVKNNN